MKQKRLFTLLVLVVLFAVLLTACTQTAPEGASTAATTRETASTTYDFADDGSAFAWPDLFQSLFLILTLGSFAWGFLPSVLDMPNSGSTRRKKWGMLVMIPSLIAFLGFSGIQVITPTNVGVIRQSFPSVTYRVVGAGTHWATPLVTRTNRYTTRIRPMKIYDIQADTNTTGRPEIYPDIVVWFRLPIDAEKELQLDKVPVDENLMKLLDLRYGPNYEEVLVKEAAINAVKSVSGAHEYDYFGVAKAEAQENITVELTPKLGGLVDITDVAISFFNYSPEFEVQLKTQAEKRLQFEAAAMDVQIAAQLEEKKKNEGLAKIAEAEADKQSAILRAQGESQATILNAQADSEAIRLIRQQINTDPAILQYEFIQRWKGDVPDVMAGGTDGLFMPIQIGQ